MPTFHIFLDRAAVSRCLRETTTSPDAPIPSCIMGCSLLLLLLLLWWCGLGCAACDDSNSDAVLACCVYCLLAGLCDFEKALFLMYSMIVWLALGLGAVGRQHATSNQQRRKETNNQKM